MKILRSPLVAFSLLIALGTVAREVPGLPKSSGASGSAKAAGCSPSTAKNELDLNNVRARIETGGNMWQNRDGSGGPAYEIPKTQERNGPNSLFAGALWMGGRSADSVLKMAAIRFRQIGNDYWPGPLTAFDTINNVGTASIDGTVCAHYDRTWKTRRQDAAAQDAYFTCLGDPGCDVATEFPGYSWPVVFDEWPAHGDVSLGQDYNLAPYHDFNGDGTYDPASGDYPGYDLLGNIDCKAKRRKDPVPLFGDQNIWWVFNDKGNTHSESGGQPIGMEIRAQGFEFATNDEVNNMSFYNYVVINQGSQTLYDTYFGQWVDPDVGYGKDDYVGCDVERGLGYAYNGDAVDEGGSYPTYGGPTPPPPAVGVDFFEGPFQDDDGIDNPLTADCSDAVAQKGITYKGIGIGYGDGFPDNERYGMRAFVYHNNSDDAATGDPDVAIKYYNYLKAIWGDNTPMTYGNSGYSTSGGVRAYYMFPGDSDPLGWGTGCSPQSTWSEQTAGNAPDDRRFIQSAGPFTLEPGAYNNITVGVVWARAVSGGPEASVELMRKADDKAQNLFDNCFRILNGPDAPTVTIQELDRELVLYLTNPHGNNIAEGYHEVDPAIPQTSINAVYTLDSLYHIDTLVAVLGGDSIVNTYLGTFPVQSGSDTVANDNEYHFQGYQIFQLKDETVGPDELKDVAKARLVAQVDIADSIKQLVNYIPDPTINLSVPVEQVNGSDKGISHSFVVKEDKFAQGDLRLKNFKTYYYMTIAYGYNNYQDFNPVQLTGQPYQYKSSRRANSGSEIQVYSGIPHKPQVENGGTQANSDYGDQFQITRLEGQGNGGLSTFLTRQTEDAIVASPIGRVDELKYRVNAGPVLVKVVDPLKVPNAQFELWFKDSTARPDPNQFKDYAQMNDAYWFLVRLGSDGLGVDTVRSEHSIQVANEQLILDWGISVTLEQTAYTGNESRSTRGLDSGIEEEGASWYAGIKDVDGEVPQNWIRSGTILDAPLYPDLGYTPTTGGTDDLPWDPDQTFEKVAGGTWAPWMVAGTAAFQPSTLDLSADALLRLSLIPSCLVVMTPDKSKWSRCVVVEEFETPANTSPANVKKLSYRPAKSVDKNGLNSDQPGYNAAEGDLISNTGMSWFPGYAIDMETGERLNMAFGENSFWGGDIGRDMIWNPSDELVNQTTLSPIFGGCHWVYVFSNRRRVWSYQLGSTSANYLPQNQMPQYDQGEFMRTKLGTGSSTDFTRVYQSCAWVGSALMKPGQHMRSMADGLVPSTLRIHMDVNKPYTTYIEPFPNPNRPAIANVAPYEPAIDPQRNDGLPLYTFSTDGSQTETNVNAVATSALDLVGVVPNPYYAFSGYETGRLDNRVKFINLPKTCTISIYTVSGTLIRRYRKDNELTYLDWDLRNGSNVPIAGGTYICHIDAPGIGEKVIKWFGVIRPVDLQNF